MGSVCSHAAALLFKLQAAAQIGLNKTSPTSMLCSWNRSRKHAEPSLLKKIDFRRPKKGSLPKEIPSCSQEEPPFSGDDPTTTGNTSHQEKLQELKLIAPNAAIFSSIAETYEDTDNSGTDTADEDDGNSIPEPLTSLFMPQSVNYSEDDVKKCGKTMFESYERSYSQSNYDQVQIKIVLQTSNFYLPKKPALCLLLVPYIFIHSDKKNFMLAT